MVFRISGFDKLTSWRFTVKPFRAALKKAAAMVFVNDHQTTVLDIIETLAASSDTPLNVRIALNEVVQFERSHPDVMLWGSLLVELLGVGLPVDDFLDALFLAAEAVERGQNDVASKHVSRLQEMIDG
jgi:hypothetical protein